MKYYKRTMTVLLKIFESRIIILNKSQSALFLGMEISERTTE